VVPCHALDLGSDKLATARHVSVAQLRKTPGLVRHTHDRNAHPDHAALNRSVCTGRVVDDSQAQNSLLCVR
jgi:hypothetical protein